ncbi:TonB-dependent receptor plug domain-containing protein [Sandarakinorhabdus limnophila]|uniref:TonB-dependent receptor plug domain-containing protein n=1 Tax=Sandarakinorhabdus limnophila TaxID=210512 RepID=UPI0037CAB210
MKPAIVALLLATPAAAAQPFDPRLPEEALITVTAPAGPGRVFTPVVGLSGEALLDRQPRSVADALRGLPGVSVRTNSRGESVARVRGSDERQTLVFLDGAPLAVPWDGRVDIGLIPAGLIGGLSVRKGAGAIEYGANAVAGIVDLTTRQAGGVAVAQTGPYGLKNLSAAGVMPLGGLSLTLAATHQAQGALPVARLSALPFSQPASDRRLNTNLAATSLFAGLGGTAGALEWRASVLNIDAHRGVAPESDRNPSSARFWRYPDWNLTQAQIALELPIGAATARAVGWRQWFGQEIKSYRDASYTTLRGREINDDDTVGGRFTLSHPIGPATLRWSLSGQLSDHHQTDVAIPPGTRPAALLYRQSLASGGVEADVPLGNTRLTLGLGLDRSANPRTGDKPGQPARQAATFSAALALKPADRLSLTVSGGRRNRFSGARELFGEALGRFLPNPALLPEQAWLADAELGWRAGRFTRTLTPRAASASASSARMGRICVSASTRRPPRASVLMQRCRCRWPMASRWNSPAPRLMPAAPASPCCSARRTNQCWRWTGRPNQAWAKPSICAPNCAASARPAIWPTMARWPGWRQPPNSTCAPVCRYCGWARHK